MFNPEVKEQFLSKYQGWARTGGYFDALEEVSEKEIAEMSVADVQNTFRKLELFELASVDALLSLVRNYVEWCRDNKVFDNYCGGFLEVSTKDYDPTSHMARMFFRDEGDFLRSLRKVRMFDEGYPEVVAMALVWLGLGYSEICALKDNHVDLESRKIYANDGEVLVSGFSDDIHSLLVQFVKCNVASRSAYNVVKDKSLDVFLKRMCSPTSDKMGTPIRPRQLTNLVNKMNMQYEALDYPPRFSMLNVQRSGALYRLWVAEQNGLDVFSKENEQEVCQIYGSKKYRGVVWQYKYYKKAFNL